MTLSQGNTAASSGNALPAFHGQVPVSDSLQWTATESELVSVLLRLLAKVDAQAKAQESAKITLLNQHNQSTTGRTNQSLPVPIRNNTKDGYDESARLLVEGFQRKSGHLERQLDLAATSFASIGGSRLIVQSMRRASSCVYNLIFGSYSWTSDANDLSWAQAERSFDELREAADALLSSLLVCQELRCFGINRLSLWKIHLNTGARAIKKMLREDQESRQNIYNYVVDELLPELMADLDEVTTLVCSLTETGILHVQKAEDNAVSRYLNMTTIATFFSGVSAATLQYSFAQTGSSLNDAVNLFWFLSLIFSIASAINSLLGVTWRKSPIAPPAAIPPSWVALWLDNAPMFFLLVAAISFIMGLTLFAYSSRQGKVVVIFITLFVTLHSVGLLVLTTWFLLELMRKDTDASVVDAPLQLMKRRLWKIELTANFYTWNAWQFVKFRAFTAHRCLRRSFSPKSSDLETLQMPETRQIIVYDHSAFLVQDPEAATKTESISSGPPQSRVSILSTSHDDEAQSHQVQEANVANVSETESHIAQIAVAVTEILDPDAGNSGRPRMKHTRDDFDPHAHA